MEDFTYSSRIESVDFYVHGSEENAEDSVVRISNKELFKGNTPVSGGIYDAHMGTTDHSWKCETCGNPKTLCPGHFGSLKLNYPVKNPMFREELLKWLKVICFRCGRLIVNKKVTSSKNKMLNKYVKEARNISNCPYCNHIHPLVEKDKHEPMRFWALYGPEGPAYGYDKKEELFNHKILDIISMISDDTVIKMGKPLKSHPRKFILDVIRIPPNTIRPDARKLGGNRSSNNDATAFIKYLVEINSAITDIRSITKQQIDVEVRQLLFNLDNTYYEMIRGSTGSGGQVRMLTSTNKNPNSIANRIPQKSGRIRKNLMGKRTWKMFRSIISCDPYLKIDEVGIPLSLARSVQIPETVRPYNRQQMEIYFMNKTKIYPGCTRIIRHDTGKTYVVDHMDPHYQLQDGDILMRDIVDGDYACFNRQPSLLFSSISSHKIVVLKTGKTLRMNVSACVAYNADFDGDAMHLILALNIQARNEIQHLSHISNWMVSPQTKTATFGCFQDSLIGTTMFTMNGNEFDKYHAMQMFGHIDIPQTINFDKKSYTNYELISMILPKINLGGKKPKLYLENYLPYIQYNPHDISIKINRGQHISGILDKNTVGQTTMGSIFHIIANEYGSERALNTIYNIQQLVNRYFFYKGFTVGIRDINISHEALRKVKDKVALMIHEAEQITDSLNKGDLLPPIGIDLDDFYEIEQINALTPGDDFANSILKDMDIFNNGMAMLVLSGSKGKMSNLIAINGAIGTQTIDGRRPPRNFSWGRTSPYFLRYDTTPKSMAYVSNSFREGIPPESFPFVAGEARAGLISNALATSVTGGLNRENIKNLETNILDNYRRMSKQKRIIQPLYAESGLDPRKTEKVKFNTVFISDIDMEKNYKTSLSAVDKRFRNKNVEKLLKEEYEQLLVDRNKFRQIFFTLEKQDAAYIMSDSHQMPVNIHRVIEDTLYNYRDISSSFKLLDPVYCIESVKTLCKKLGYAYTNDIQEQQNAEIAPHHEEAMVLLKILLRSYLCTSHLLRKGITNELLDIIIKKVRYIFDHSMWDYGTCVGIYAAQSNSEPMTQYILDSKHRTGGGGGTKTNAIVRIKEILGAKDTEGMKNPSMVIFVSPEYECDKVKVQKYANFIEMMTFKRFIYKEQLFFEEYGVPTHPDYSGEEKMIKLFEKHNIGINVPSDLAKWCLRFELNKETMLLKSMNLNTIISKLRKSFPDMFFVYTSENTDTVIIRAYIRNTMIKPVVHVQIEQYLIKELLPKLEDTIIRGIQGITNTDVFKVAKTKLNDDGSLSMEKSTYAIQTDGTNLEDVLELDFVDPYRTQSDSILEIEKMYGIYAARQKIISEFVNTMDVSKYHTTVFADEMTYSGRVTSIQRSGLQKREMANVNLRLSFQSPIQVIEDAAINGYVDTLSGISGHLICGQIPKIGTTYNSIIVDEEFIKKNTESIDDQLDDL